MSAIIFCMKPSSQRFYFADNHDIISMKMYQLMVEHTAEEDNLDWTKIEPSVSLLKSPKGSTADLHLVYFLFNCVMFTEDVFFFLLFLFYVLSRTKQTMLTIQRVISEVHPSPAGRSSYFCCVLCLVLWFVRLLVRWSFRNVRKETRDSTKSLKHKRTLEIVGRKH